MRLLLNLFKFSFLSIALIWSALIFADNQTSEISPILSDQELPFRIRLKLVKKENGNPLLLPEGIHSYAYGIHGDKWIFIAGRTNGMHGFSSNDNNFPPQKQNQTIYVVDIKTQKIWARSLTVPKSGLNQDEIDSLSTTASQFYQVDHTLYIAGGYGFRNKTGQYDTFNAFTAIDIPGMIDWVIHPKKSKKASRFIRQISDPIFKVTGGAMYQLTQDDPTLLIFGQNFEGVYHDENNQQVYTREIRRFKIHDDGVHLGFTALPASVQDEIFRRRDLNVTPVVKRNSYGKGLHLGLVALSGVFTESGGAWTVPVSITAKGVPSMADPIDPVTFKQGMNNYICPFMNLYSRVADEMYTVLFGGITFEYFQDGELQQDDELPFTNEITTIKLNKHGVFTQHLMKTEYPVIQSTQSNAGNRLLFGASANFIPAPGLEKLQYGQAVFKFDVFRRPIVLGYIVGGIQSTLMNTETKSDSSASPYIFKVILEPVF